MSHWICNVVRVTRPRYLSWALILLVLAAFWPLSQADFTYFDDGPIVINNPNIRRGFSLSSLRWALTTRYHDYWHPIPWITHILDYKLYSLAAGGHHITNLLFHCGAVVTFFVWLFRATHSLWPAAFAAAVFAIHPVNVEPVAWLSARKDVTCALFWNLTLLAYVEFVLRRSWKWYAGSVALYAVTLMSKPMAMTLPFVMLLLDYWPLGRHSSHRIKENPIDVVRWQWKASFCSWGRLIVEKTPFFVLSLGSILFTYHTYQRGGFLNEHIPLSIRISYVPLSYVMYLSKQFWPARLSILYPLPPHPPEPVLAFSLAVLLCVITVVTMIGASRVPWLTIGWLWFAGTLVPVSGIVHTGHQLFADRFAYLPSLGLYITLAWSLSRIFLLVQRQWRQVIVLGSTLLLVVLLAQTVRQVSRWRDSQTLFAHCLRVTHRNYPLENNLGCIHHTDGVYDSARFYYRRSLESHPGHCRALYNIALTYAAEKLFDSSALYFRQAIYCSPRSTEARIGLAASLMERGFLSVADSILKETIRIDSSNASAYAALGFSSLSQNRAAEATQFFERALQLNPSSLIYCRWSGIAAFNAGFYRKAVIYLNAALRTSPSADLYGYLALAYHGLNCPDSARWALTHARQLAPDSVRYAIALARTLADMGHLSDALCEYRAAFCLCPDDVIWREMKAQVNDSLLADTSRCSCPAPLGSCGGDPAGSQSSSPGTKVDIPNTKEVCRDCHNKIPFDMKPVR